MEDFFDYVPNWDCYCVPDHRFLRVPPSRGRHPVSAWLHGVSTPAAESSVAHGEGVIADGVPLPQSDAQQPEQRQQRGQQRGRRQRTLHLQEAAPSTRAAQEQPSPHASTEPILPSQPYLCDSPVRLHERVRAGIKF